MFNFELSASWTIFWTWT